MATRIPLVAIDGYQRELPAGDSLAGVGGLTNFTEAANTSSPNATVPVVSLNATNAATNVDVAFSPKGAGALTAQAADGTAAGGNKRGSYAVDFQRVRNGAEQVASGPSSTIGGGGNNRTGDSFATVGGGYANASYGYCSTIGGGFTNGCIGNYSTNSGGNNNSVNGLGAVNSGGSFNTVSAKGAVNSGGGSNTANGEYAFNGGGSDNKSSSLYSTNIGGTRNTSNGYASSNVGGELNSVNNNYGFNGGGTANGVSGSYSVNVGGNKNASYGVYSTNGGGFSNEVGVLATNGGGMYNKASGQYSTTGGGYSNAASGDYSAIPGGYGASTKGLFGKFAYAAGNFSAVGDAQYGLAVLRAITTGTAVVFTADGLAPSAINQIIVSAGQAMTFTGSIIGKQSGSAILASYTFNGSMVNHGGAVTVVASLVAVGEPPAAWTAPTLAADNTRKGLTIKSGFLASTNINWVCTVQSAELIFG